MCRLFRAQIDRGDNGSVTVKGDSSTGCTISVLPGLDVDLQGIDCRAISQVSIGSIEFAIIMPQRGEALLIAQQQFADSDILESLTHPYVRLVIYKVTHV